MTAPFPPLAHHFTPGAAPTVIFLPGYASDMSRAKALALEAWASRTGRAYLRFDYRGCGTSGGDFADQRLADWRDDVVAVIDAVAGPVVLVGSSMGGWLMLLAALARPERVAALVGIAAAPDFTDWGFTTDEKMTILSEGRIERTNPYGPAPTLYTRAFWSSGEALRLMAGVIAVDAPVRLIHGMADPDVPYLRSVRLAELLRSADVQTILIKDGDHRLSRVGDIAMLIRTIEDLMS
ncbi:MAG: alpha/beta hydrolase [Sphingomonas hengshuiensis]|nr:MAG: alpha/beta hydrolase [Sphingomonas hengshuiensis]